MGDVNAIYLTSETTATLDGTENVVMFDSAEGKRATLTAISNYILEKHIPTGMNEAIQAIVKKLDDAINEIDSSYGSPLVASTVQEMEDVSRIYVYTGSESGYTNGNWYYWNGSAWTSGGTYNSVAVQTDTTLSVSGKAADSKTVGDRFATVTTKLSGYDELFAEAKTTLDYAGKHADEIDAKVEQILAIKTDADQIAAEALETAGNAMSEAAESTTAVAGLKNRVDALELANGGYVDDGYVENGVAYFTHNGSVLFEITGIGGGSGGGGGETISAVLTVTNTTGWLSKTIASGASCPISFTWTSIEDDMPTGNGTLRITNNGSHRGTVEIQQGNVSLDIGQYLVDGSNIVKVQISDVYGQSRSINFSVTAVSLSLSSTFDVSQTFDGIILFPYTPVGAVAKNIHFIVDGNEIATYSTSVSNRQLTQSLPAQSHGGHQLRVYFDADINGETVTSNELYYEFISVEPLANDVIIVSSYRGGSVQQYSSVYIPYRVYNPASDTANVEIYLNETKVSEQAVDRTEQSFSFRANETGNVAVKIVSGNATKTISVTVEESEIDVEAETQNLALYLTAEGRSNNEETRNVWEYNGISANLENFGWVIDGWQSDSDKITVLRLSGDARVTIPYKLFGTDFKSTGKTIEIEFATREVADYSAEIVSCFADNIGLKITPQNVLFKGGQNEISTLYKDNEHIRLSIVVEKQSENRLVLIYINGIMSRAIQYASGERFSQLTPVDISIGSNNCGIDIYNIRVYDNDLNREQILDNWIADTQVGSVMLERYIHNNVYDEYGRITAANLPKDLPYFILEATELPQYKGDKKTISGSYTDPAYPSKSFTFEGCQINVQGTSSSIYYRKNYDMQFKGGFNTASSGNTGKYALRAGSIPFNRFVLKADVASSESTNNTGLTMFYNDSCPYKTLEMLADSRVRWGIEGIPIAVFWYNPDTQETQFLGKYNFNLPKRAPEPYGYSGNDQSWEWERNNSANVKFQDDDFTSQSWDEINQKYYPTWYDDFEARFPSDEWRDYAKLKEFISWVKSTWREQATNTNLSSSVTYRLNSTITVDAYPSDSSYTVVDEMEEGVATGWKLITFTKDTPAYRLSKFRAEFADYAEVDSAVFYYLFTELFLMIDSRAKNMFVGFHGSRINDPNRQMDRKAVFEPYDMDTAIGTNNSGVLMFGYYLEDTDTVSSIISGGDSGGSDANVFNAQDSVLFTNLRDSFRSEITAMYRNLRAGAWSYNAIETMYENHQAKWPEAIFNEDAYVKYLTPLVEPVTYDEDTGQYIKTDRYLTMLQGSKAEQRKWWLYNRFRYMDSKFVTGDASGKTINMRLFNSGTLTLKSAIDMYLAVSFGGGTTVALQRTTAGTPVSFTYQQESGVQEMETWIYSADMITDVGDLSVFYPNELDFSKATRLKRLQIGNSASGYSNTHLTTIDVRNSALLEYIDLRNCTELAITVNLEGSPRLEEAYFDNTKVTGVDLADGCAIEKLHLPGTITALTLLNLNKLTEFTCPSYANVTRLMLDNMNSLDIIGILQSIRANSQVNIKNLYLELENASAIDSFLDLLDTMQGVTREMGQNGEWIYHDFDKAQVSGEIHTDSLTGSQIAEFNARYPYIKVTADHTSSVLRFYNGSTLITSQTVLDGGDGTYSGSTPTKTQDAQYTYTFSGWSKDFDDNTVDSDALTAVTADRNVYACYSQTLRKYTVTFVKASADGGGTLQTITDVAYGTSITASSAYTGSTPTSSQGSASDYPFEGWEPASATVTGNTTFTAKFGSRIEVAEISDSWNTIIANIDNGTYSTKYKVGNYKPLDLGTEGTINMQIVAMDADELADGSGTAPLTFIGMELLTTAYNFSQSTSNYIWDTSEIRSYLKTTIFSLIPSNVRNRINSVKKYTNNVQAHNKLTEENIWIPSAMEIGFTTNIESSGVKYGDIYFNDASRIKYRTNTEYTGIWWTRTAGTGSAYRICVSKKGRAADDNLNYTNYIALGFCLGLEH